jgi:alpha-L-arabinofuranosidase
VRGRLRSNKRVRLAFDEWNVWYRARGSEHTRGGWLEAPALLEETYNLEDALVCAQYLAAFLRRADLVKVACIAQIVNAIAPVMTRSDGLWLQTIYHPFALFSEHAHGVALAPRTSSPTYLAGARGEAPVLDAAASFDPATGAVAVFLVNRSRHASLPVEVRLDDRLFKPEAGCTLLSGGDLKLENSWAEPQRVTPRPGRVERTERGLSVEVPAPGLAVVHARTRPR